MFKKNRINTYLAGEIPWSRRWFSQGEAYPLHSGCADPCDFPKCGKLDCIICGSGGLRSRSPLIIAGMKVRVVFFFLTVFVQSGAVIELSGKVSVAHCRYLISNSTSLCKIIASASNMFSSFHLTKQCCVFKLCTDEISSVSYSDDTGLVPLPGRS